MQKVQPEYLQDQSMQQVKEKNGGERWLKRAIAGSESQALNLQELQLFKSHYLSDSSAGQAHQQD